MTYGLKAGSAKREKTSVIEVEVTLRLTVSQSAIRFRSNGYSCNIRRIIGSFVMEVEKIEAANDCAGKTSSSVG
jgi:hypothetical protein